MKRTVDGKAQAKPEPVYDRAQGGILVLSRLVNSDSSGYTLLDSSTTKFMFDYINQPAIGPITPSEMSDYLVKAFDRGFCTCFDLEAATFAWLMPSGELVYQHST